MSKGKVAVAMSGGVDSSYTAWNLLQQGYEVIGISFPVAKTSWKDAKKVAEALKIQYHIVDIKTAFENVVIKKFIHQYSVGLTPNPCIICNKYIKFGILFNYVRNVLKTDLFATGHYVRIEKENNHLYLKKASDERKDQSYFLYQISKKNLPYLIFPCGEYNKDVIRGFVKDVGFYQFQKSSESYDICFIPQGSYREFLSSHYQMLIKKGNFVDAKGNILVPHDGISLYTVGQRKKMNAAFGKRQYIRKIDPMTHDIEIGEKPYISKLRISGSNMFLDDSELSKDREYDVKIRYKSTSVKGLIYKMPQISNRKDSDISYGKQYEIIFSNPCEASSLGQSAVIYDNDIIIGGGFITDYTLI